MMKGILIPVGSGDPFPLHKTEMVVGRHKSCDIVLNFSNVSSKHCKLVLSEGYWYILDLQSTNGVKVNGKKVTDARIDPDAIVTISKHGFKLEYDPVRNGATGQPPDSMLHARDILSQSLLQRAGLEKAKPQDLIENEEDEVQSEQPDQTAATPAVHHVPRDFFSELVFD